jgi:dTDP-4-dehydrorhamnose 3,5-epimerase
MKLTVTKTLLEGVVLIDTQYVQDERGFFIETWHQRDYALAGLPMTFVQDNHSRSSRGVLRGLHYQDERAPLGKLIRCTVGEIFDVAVDLRVGAPTFGQWMSAELSVANKRQIYVPPGFAHGFQALSEFADVQYRQTAFYTPEAEHTIAWDDPDIAVAWPIVPPILSRRDQQGQALRDYRESPAFRVAETTSS